MKVNVKTTKMMTIGEEARKVMTESFLVHFRKKTQALIPSST